jgi:hypothetical protein
MDRLALLVAPGRSLLRRNMMLMMANQRFLFSSINYDNQNTSDVVEWRKQQLSRLENNVKSTIESDEDLQPMWSSMEKRVKGRRPRTLQESAEKVGRQNIKRSEEDVWQEEGLYDQSTNNSNK